ncbi:MAG: alpha-L-rhamnosidase N-terminal domain-containing protein [Opitutales bacterium]
MKERIHTVVLIFFGVITSALAVPSNLRCEYLENPVGIDVAQPRLSWTIPHKTRGDVQTAYRVKVSSEPTGGGDLWDSGKVESDQSIHVKYEGPAMRSGQRCYWTVETFGKGGVSHGVSEVAAWSIGLLDTADWEGSWIRAAGAGSKAHIWYRKKLQLEDAVDNAFAYVASLGFHELYVNGKKADDRLMAPTLTALNKRVHYVTYDISSLLQEGENVIAIWYGPGWTTFGSYRMIPKGIKAQVNIETDGKHLSISTDSTWKWKLSSSEHVGGWGHTKAGGDKIVASRLEPDWNRVDYDDSDWKGAEPLNFEAELSAEMIAPDRVIEEIKVIETVKVDSAYQISLEKNFTGFVEVALKGPANGEVTIKVKDDQKSDPKGEYGEFGQTNIFVFDESGEGVFRNRFNYLAGREIEITGVSEKPVLTAYAVSNDFKQTGSFESSNELLNEIYETDLWTFRANTINGVTMDCPHRERLGYGEITFATAWGIGLPNFETGSYYKKIIQGWMDVQHSDGKILFVAPTPNKTWGGPLWSSAPLTVTYEMYRAFGDTGIVSYSYPTMKKWLDFLDSKIAADGVLVAFDGGNRFLGEWSAPLGRKNSGKSSEAELFNNCVYAMILDMFVEMAGAVGRDKDVQIYSERRDTLRRHVHAKFFDEAKSNYIDNIQTHLAAPLLSGVTPSEHRDAVVAVFENEILNTTPYLDMGSSGLPLLLKFLIEDADRSDIVAKHLNKETHPSYGYFLSRGETTWPEYWSSVKSSKIHTCYTGIASFYQKGALGIQNAKGSIGHKRFWVKPGVFDEITWARGSKFTMYGLISTEWRKEDNGDFTLSVTVPGNTTAELYLPKPEDANEAFEVSESGSLCWKNGAFVKGTAGVMGARNFDDYIILNVGSGEYQFNVSQSSRLGN